MRKLFIISTFVSSLFSQEVFSTEMQEEISKKITGGMSCCKNKEFTQAIDCLHEVLIDNINSHNLLPAEEARARLCYAELLRSNGGASSMKWRKIEVILSALFRSEPSSSPKFSDHLLKSFEQLYDSKSLPDYYPPLLKDGVAISKQLDKEELSFAKLYYAEALNQLERYEEALTMLSPEDDNVGTSTFKAHAFLCKAIAECQLGNFTQANTYFLWLNVSAELFNELLPLHKAMGRLYLGKTRYELNMYNAAEKVFLKLFSPGGGFNLLQPEQKALALFFRAMTSVKAGSVEYWKIFPKLFGVNSYFKLLKPEQEALARLNYGVMLSNSDGVMLSKIEDYAHFSNTYYILSGLCEPGGYSDLLQESQRIEAMFAYAITLYRMKMFETSLPIFFMLLCNYEAQTLSQNVLTQIRQIKFFCGKALFLTENFESAANVLSDMKSEDKWPAMGRLCYGLSLYKFGKAEKLYDVLSEAFAFPVERFVACVLMGLLENKRCNSPSNMIDALNHIFGSLDKEVIWKSVKELCELIPDDIFNLLFKSPNEMDDDVEEASLATKQEDKVINMLSPGIRTLAKAYFSTIFCKGKRYPETAQILEEFFDEDGNCNELCNAPGVHGSYARYYYVKALRGIGKHAKAEKFFAKFYRQQDENTRTAYTPRYNDAFYHLLLHEQADILSFKGVTSMI